MPTDLTTLDMDVRAAVRAWRSVRPQPTGGLASPGHNPLEAHPAFRSLATYAELLERREEPLAGALAPWVAALFVERACFMTSSNLAVAWLRPQPVAGGAEGAHVSPRQLLRRLLGAPDLTARQRAAGRLVACCGEVQAAAQESFAQRLAAEQQLFGAAHATLPTVGAAGDDDLVSHAAQALFTRTDALLQDDRPSSWWDGVEQALGSDAREGWPARLRPRWIREVFSGTPLANAPAGPGSQPSRPLGALSFGCALGGFGVALLDEARDHAAFFSPHQHPFDVRRHERFALFTSVVAEPSFARRVLGLGERRATAHRRAVGRAILRSLRIDGWRVGVATALRQSPSEASDRYGQLAVTALGVMAPVRLLGVLPSLRPTDGCALVGRLLAATRRAELIDEFDDDWFRNPRAAEWLHEADLRPSGVRPLRLEDVDAALDHLCTALGQASG